jgi:hypothetical protein
MVTAQGRLYKPVIIDQTITMAEVDDYEKCPECGHEHTAPDGSCRCGCSA